MFNPYLHITAVAFGIALYVLVTHAGRRRRTPSAAIAWVVAMIAFPYATIPLFVFFGSRKFVRPALGVSWRVPIHPSSAGAEWNKALAASLGLAPARDNARITVFEEGPAALDALIAMIGNASRRIDLCTFIFADDEAGRRVVDALTDCAVRGCRVRVLLDALGGVRMSRDMRRRLAHAGVVVRKFMPLLHAFGQGRGNLRNHRKLVVVDGWRFWSGGRNIADEYFLDRSGRAAWLDMSFVVEGDLAADAALVFERDWVSAGGFSGEVRSTEADRSAATSQAVAQLIPSGPDQAADAIHAVLLNAIYHAKTRVLAATPYFVADASLLEAIVIACRRGVRVSLLLPRRSNHRLADWARERDLRELAAAGADIRLLPTMLHAKVVVVDDLMALCGSANLDSRSLFLNYELATAFYSPPVIDVFARWHERIEGLAQQYVPRSPSLARDIAEGMVRSIGFQL